MKKIYLSLMAAAAITSASAQDFQTQLGGTEKGTNNRPVSTENTQLNKATANVPVVDTLDYFFLKHFLRNAPPNNGSFSTIKNAPTYTNTNSGARWGAMFQNSGSLVVYGAEVLSFAQANAPSGTVNVQFGVYNVTAGVPAGAPLATFTTGIPTGTAGSYYGGNFTNSVIVTGDYAIMVKNISANNADTIRIFLTNANTATSTAVQNQRFGESFGNVQTQGGTFFNLTNVFGSGTDFEPIITARIGYLMTADAVTTASTCNTSPVNYPNTSSAWINHRQYNLNRFLNQWAPFGNTTGYNTLNALKDSIFTWNFGDGATQYGLSPTHTYSLVTMSGPVNDQLIARVFKMAGSGAKVTDSKAWTTNVQICNVGLTENSLESKLAVYPNPATDKVVVYLNNANSNTTIQVLNALGQVVYTKNNVSDRNEISTAAFAQGVYFVRVTNGKEVATTKLVINN